MILRIQYDNARRVCSPEQRHSDLCPAARADLALIGRGRSSRAAQLPTMRQVAVALSIDLNTVQRAYAELERDGVLPSARVSAPLSPKRRRAPRNARKQTQDFAARDRSPGQGAGHRPGRTRRGAGETGGARLMNHFGRHRCHRSGASCWYCGRALRAQKQAVRTSRNNPWSRPPTIVSRPQRSTVWA